MLAQRFGEVKKNGHSFLRSVYPLGPEKIMRWNYIAGNAGSKLIAAKAAYQTCQIGILHERIESCRRKGDPFNAQVAEELRRYVRLLEPVGGHEGLSLAYQQRMRNIRD